MLRKESNVRTTTVSTSVLDKRQERFLPPSSSSAQNLQPNTLRQKAEINASSSQVVMPKISLGSMAWLQSMATNYSQDIVLTQDIIVRNGTD